jgi:dienelactone hydrolase
MPAECTRADFRSGGKSVRAALCRPAKTDRAPAVVVLHGRGGFDTLDHRIAVDLPKAGIATLYVAPRDRRNRALSFLDRVLA